MGRSGLQSWDAHPEGATIQATERGGYQQVMGAQRDTFFAAGRSDRYGGDVQLTISLTKTWQPSTLANSVGMNLPHYVSAWWQDTANQRREGHTAVVVLKERVLIPHAVIHHEIVPEPVPASVAAIEEEPVTPGRTAGALAITAPDLLDRRVISLGFDHEKLQVLFEEVMAKLAGNELPASGQRSHAVARLTEHGTRAQDALRYLLSHPVFTRYLDRQLGDGMTMPEMVRPGGAWTDTHGELGVQVELAGRPHVLGYLSAWDEAVQYGFDEQEQHRSRTGGWALGATGGAAFNTGNSPSAADFAVDLSFGSREQRWSNAIQQTMTKVDALNRALSWLRVSPDALITVTLTARNERDWIRISRLGTWLGGGRVAVRFRVRHALELALSPEASIRLGIYHPGGIPVGSGTFFPPPPGRRPASIEDLVRAAFSLPFLEGAFGIQIDWDGDHFLAGDREIDAIELAAAINTRLGELGDPPSPDLLPEERPPPAPTRLTGPDDPIVLISPNAAVIAPGRVVSAAQALADAIGRPVLAPDSGYVITRDGSVLAVRIPGPDGAAFGRGWQPGNWVLTSPRDRNLAPHTLPRGNLADAIRAGREPGHLGWAVQVGGRPGLVPPPGHDVRYPAETPQGTVDSWRDDVTATQQLANAARELLPYTGDKEADLRARLDQANHAVRAVPAPPAALPASPQDMATAWQGLGRFQLAADELGRAVADVLTGAFARWQEWIDPVLDRAERVREVLPRTAGQEPEPDLADALERLDAAVRAIPRPPTALPASVAQVSDVRSAIARIKAREPQHDASEALSAVLTIAIGQWNARVASARRTADGVENLLRYTGGQEDRLRRGLAAAGAAPLDASAGDALDALRKVAALEDAAAAVFTTATAMDGLQLKVAAAPSLFRAANEMLPFTIGTPGLTNRLHEATQQLMEIWAEWWQASGRTAQPDRSSRPAKASRRWLEGKRQPTIAKQVVKARQWLGNGPDLTTADYEAVAQWLAGDGPARLRRAIRDFERAITNVATAATQASERLERLVRQANALLPDTGTQRRALGLALFQAGGTPAGAEFRAPRWPTLSRRTALAAVAAAAQIQAAALRHRRLDDTARSQSEAAITARRAQLEKIQDTAAELAVLQPQRLEDAVASVFEAAIAEWRPRLKATANLVSRLASLPETLRSVHLQQWDLLSINRSLSTYVDNLDSVVQGLRSTAGMDEAVRWLDTVPYLHRMAEDAIRNTIGVLVDEPMRPMTAAVGLNGEIDGLLPHVPEPLRDNLRPQRAVIEPFRAVPGSVAQQPLAAIDEALSQGLALLRGLEPVIPDFTANVARAIGTGWQSRVLMVTDLAGRAQELLRQADAQLADPRLQNLDEDLAAARQNLPAHPPGLSAPPRLAELDAARQALESATAVESAAGQVVASVNAILEEHATAARELAAVAAAPGLLHRLGERQHELGAALQQAGQNVHSRAGTQPGQLPMATTVDDARQRLDRLIELQDATRAVLTAATAGPKELRPRVEAAERLASDARSLLPRTGQQQAQLTGWLDGATGQLQENRPGWWASETAPATAREAEAATRALSDGLEGTLLASAGAIEDAVAALLGAVDVEAWQQTVGRLQDAAVQAENLLPHAGDQRAQLEAAMQSARARADEAAAGIADQLQRLPTDVPDQDRVAEMRAVIQAIASDAELEAAIRRVTDAAGDTAVRRAAALLSLAPYAGGLLSLAVTPPGPLGDELGEAERNVRALPGQPARPQTAQEAIAAAAQAANRVNDLRQAIGLVLTQAAGQLPGWAESVQRLLTDIGVPPPLSGSQRDDLAAFIQVLSTPEIDVAVLDPGVVRQGTTAATILEAAASRALDPAIWRQRAQDAIDWAQAARLLRGTGGQQADVEAVRNAVARLPEGRRGVAEITSAEVTALREVAAAVTSLESANKQAITTATAGIDVPRPEVEADARPVVATAPAEISAPRPEVEAAEIARATEGLRVRERVAGARRLAKSALALLEQVGEEAAHDLRNRRPTLDSDLRSGRLPVGPLSPLDTAAALAGVARNESASADVLSAAARSLETVRRDHSEAMVRASAARSLLAHDGPRQAELTARLAAASREPYAVTKPDQTGHAWPSAPQPDSRVTVAELNAARQAVTERAQALRSATENLNRVAADVLATAPARWRRQNARARALEQHVRELFPRARELPADTGSQRLDVLIKSLPVHVRDELPDDLTRAFHEHARAWAQARASKNILSPARDHGVLRPVAATAAAAHALMTLANATQRLTDVLRATAWWRADALLGPDHGFIGQEVTMVMDMVDLLAPGGQPDAERFSWLASKIGLHNQDLASRATGLVIQRPVRARLFAHLLLAVPVLGATEGSQDADSLQAVPLISRPSFGGTPSPTRAVTETGSTPGATSSTDTGSTTGSTPDVNLYLAGLADLRRLTDLVRARTRRGDVTLDDLRDEYRAVYNLEAHEEVTLFDLKQLVWQVGQVKAIGGRVRHADLLRLAETERRVEEARSYLAAEQDLTERERRDLLRNLLGGQATHNALNAALDLLFASSPDDLRRLFEDDRLAAQLSSAIPPGHWLHEKLSKFTTERFAVPPRQTARPASLPIFVPILGAPFSQPIPRPVPLADRPFSPKMIDPSLKFGVDSDLTPEQLEAAVSAADKRGWRRTGAPHSAEAVIRRLGLSLGEQARAEAWLTRLARAAERQEDIRGHFSGDPRLGLDLVQQGQEWPGQDRMIWSALGGLAPGQVLELLEDITDDDLKVLVANELIEGLETAFPSGPLRERVDGFLARRLRGRQVIEPTVPARPFGPEMISPQLDRIGLRRDLTPEELTLVGAVIAARTRTEVAADLPRIQRVQAARFDWWWNEVGEPARLAHAAREYLDGSLVLVQDDEDLRSALIDPLVHRLEQTAWRVLDLLEALDDHRLAWLFADGQLRPQLLRAIHGRPIVDPGHVDDFDLRIRLGEFFVRRFDGENHVRSVHRPRPFTPEMISPRLAGVGIRDPLTPAQVLVVVMTVAGRSDVQITDPLDLPPVEEARVRRWLREVREAMVDWVLRYVAGTKGYDMTAVQMWAVVRLLLNRPVPGRAPRAVLVLLERIDDAQRAGLFADDVPMASLCEDHPPLADDVQLRATLLDKDLEDLLKQAIPGGQRQHTELRTRLEQFFESWSGPEIDEPGQPFSLGLLGAALKNYPVEPGRDGRRLKTGAYIRILRGEYAKQGYTARINNDLVKMSPAEQARAMSWLTRLRVEVHEQLLGRSSSMPHELPALRALDGMLSRLYAEAARRIQGASELGDLTVIPLGSQERQLREVLIPAVVQAGPAARRKGFTDQLPGQDQGFRDRLRQAFLEQIDDDERHMVHGKGLTERAIPGKLYSRDHVQEIANLVLDWVTDVFGRFAKVPQRMVVAEPGNEGDIYDGFEYYEWLWRSWTPAAHRTNAKGNYLMTLVTGVQLGKPARVAEEHGAAVLYDLISPLNEETRIADAVIDELLDDPETVRRIVEIRRRWVGEANQLTNEIHISFFREEGRDVETLWLNMAYMLIHEVLHTMEHPDYQKYTRSSPGDVRSPEFHTLTEGVTSLLTEIVWANVMAQLTETVEGGQTNLENWSRIILGPHYVSPDVRTDPPRLQRLTRARYPAEAEAIRLISLVGIENLLAAYFGGQTSKIAGAVPGSRGSMLAPHDTFEQPRQPARSPSPPPSEDDDEAPQPPQPPQPPQSPHPPAPAPSSAGDEAPPPQPRPPQSPRPPAPAPSSAGDEPPPRPRRDGDAPVAAGWPPSEMVRVPATGSCLLYSVIAAAPELVRDQLIEHGFLSEGTPIADWLAQPEQVRGDSESWTEIRSLPGNDFYQHEIMWLAGEQLRLFTLSYLQRNRAALPEAVQQVRAHFFESVDRQIRALPDEDLIPALQERGVTYVEDAAYVPIDELREMYRDQLPAGTTVLADDELSPQAMLDYLVRLNMHIPLDELSPDTLRRYLLASSILRSGPLDDIEFAALRDAVGNWESSWASPEGEAFLPLLAHALGIQAQVVQYRRQNPPGTGQWEDAAPFPLHTVGGEGDRAVYLYYDGANHYNGSAPRVTVPAAPDTRPAHTVEDIAADLLEVPFDAIVNPTDETLTSREGISNEILEGGRQALQDEIAANYPFGIAVGEAAATTARGTGAQYVIHVAVPDFRHGRLEENERALRKAYVNALARADHLGLRTIAVPLLSGTDPRNGRIDQEVLRGIIRDTLATTPTTSVRQVFVVRQPTAEAPQVSPLPAAVPAPPARTGPSDSLGARIKTLLTKRQPKPAFGPSATTAPRESAADLLAERKQRKAQQGNFRRMVMQSYPSILDELGITAVEAGAGGDCFFHSVIAMWRDQIRRDVLRGQEPTPDRLRDWLADLVRDDFARADSQYAAFFEGATTGSAADQRAVRARVVATIRARGSWDNDTGDTIPQIFAEQARLPMTMVGLNIYHLGPSGEQPQFYIVYDGSHYRGATATGPVLPAEEVRSRVEAIRAGVAHQPALSAARPADEETLARRRNIYIEEFGRLLAEFRQLFGQPRADYSEQVLRAANQAADTFMYFDDHIESGLTQRAVDALGGLIEKLDTALATLRQGEEATQPAAADSAPSAPEASTPFGPRVRRRRRRSGEGLTGVATLRLGDRWHELGGRVLAYLGLPGTAAGSGSEQEKIEQLTAVLAEALGQAGEGTREPEWDTLVTEGLQRLRLAAEISHTAELPHIEDPASLAEDDPVIVPGLIRAHANAGSIPDDVPVRYEISSHSGRNASGLVGGTSDLVMFDRDQHFEVISNTLGPDGRRLIKLREAASGELTAGVRQDAPLEPDTEVDDADEGSSFDDEPGDYGSEDSSAGGDRAGDDAAWRVANRWWTEESGLKTLNKELYSPSARQREYLNARRLQILWVPADGDCNFTAVTLTVPHEELRAQILRAAQQRGIEVPSEEDRQGTDEVGWLVGQAVAAALKENSQLELRRLIADALKQEGRITERPPDGANRAGWLSDRAVGRLSAVPPLGPGELVTGQHLRLLLAYLWELNSQGWGAEGFFAPDGSAPNYPGELVQTRSGMGAALRWLTDYGEPYANVFPQLIADFLDLPLQVLWVSGEVVPPEQDHVGEAPPYTIVHVDEHYLATRHRPDPPAASPALTAEQPVEEESSASDPKGSSQSSRERSIRFNGSPEPSAPEASLGGFRQAAAAGGGSSPLESDTEADDTDEGSSFDDEPGDYEAEESSAGDGDRADDHGDETPQVPALAVPEAARQAGQVSASPVTRQPPTPAPTVEEPAEEPPATESPAEAASRARQAIEELRKIVLGHPSDRDSEPDAAPAPSTATDPARTGTPAQEATAPGPDTSATQRHDQPQRQVSFNVLPSAVSRAPAVEEGSASDAEDSPQGSLKRPIRFNGSPAPSPDSPAPSRAAGEPSPMLGGGEAAPRRRPNRSGPGPVLGEDTQRLNRAVASFNEPVNAYLAALPFSADPEARQQLSAVLAEAQAQASGQPATAGPAWRELADHGLSMLRPTRSQRGYAAALPGAEPDRLTPGASFTIETPALAYDSAESVPGGGYLLEIEWPEAHDLTGLAGDGPGRMMFAAGTPFVVRGISERDGRTVIHVAHQDAAALDVAALEGSRLRREQQPGQEPPPDPRTLERHREVYLAGFRAVQERFQELSAPPAAVQSAETVGHGRRAIEHFLGLSGAVPSQHTIDMLGQLYARLREVTRDLDDPFAGLPEEAVAVRRSDGAYMTPPSDGRRAGQIDLPLPRFFTARSEPLPLTGVRSADDGEVVRVAIDESAGALDPAVLYPAMWYLAADTRAEEIEAEVPVTMDLAERLQERLGMSASMLSGRREGRTSHVAANARNAATDAGWIFRPSDSAQPRSADAQVQSYLERNPSLAGGGWQQVRERLTAVLMEARAQGFPQAAGPSPEWNALVARGLDLLPPTGGIEGYADVLPGPDPAALGEGEEFSITGPALGYVFRDSAGSDSTLFVIDRPAAGDVSLLTGDPFGRIMFAPGTSFVVTSVHDEEDRRVIRLSHLEELPSSPDEELSYPDEERPEEEYLAGSGFVLPQGMDRAEAVAALRRVAEAAGYRGAQAVPEPQADSLLRQGLGLLGGFAGLRVYVSIPAEALTTPTDDGEPLYRQGRVIEAAGLTVGLAEPGGVPAGHVRVVIFPRPAGGGSGARDAGWLLGAGVVVFGPGTRFEVAAVDAAHGELSWRELADAAAPVLAPEVAGQPLTAAPFGLARPEVMVTYADEIARLAGVWERLWEPERVYALQIAINAALARIGVPPVRVTAARPAAMPARFDAASWEIHLAPAELPDLWHMAMAIYREARHAESLHGTGSEAGAFDAFMLQARVQHELEPGAVPVEDHRYPPPGEMPLLRYSRAMSYRVHHLWVGLRPSPVVEALLPAPLGNGVVIHGWGDAGRLVADGGVDLARVSLPRADVVVLAHDAHVDVQALANERDRPVWAPEAPVWVSLGTGAVFLGEAQVDQDGLLQAGRAAQLVQYVPGGNGQPVPPAAGERPPVLRVLTAGQAAADPGPWQLRGSDPRQPVPPAWGPRQEDAEAFGKDLNDREQAEAEDAARADSQRVAAEELGQAATRMRIPGGMVSAGPRWHSRFGGLIGAVRPEPGQYVLGLEVGPAGRLALWDGGDVYTDLDAEAVEQLRAYGWAGENLLIITERRPFDEMDEQLAELAEALGVGISVESRSAWPGPGPGTGLVPADPPGDTVAVGGVAGAEVRIVVRPAQDGSVDLGPVRALLRDERVFGLVEAFLGLAPGTLISAVIGASHPVRIQVAAMPAGAAGDAVIRRLWDEFAGSARVAFAPAPGHRVLVAEDGSLAVVTEGREPGWWVQVGSGLPGRYLGRDLMNPDVEVTEDELILWMVRDSAVPASLETEPGESERTFGLEVEFVFEDDLSPGDRARRVQRIVNDLRRFGLAEQTGIGGYHSTRGSGYRSERRGWRVEDDETVHGEVVSPILPYRDSVAAQRVWRDIALVLGVIRRHGGGNDSRAGGHVHAGVADYHRDVARMLGLISLFRAHQDSLYRLAATPGETFTRLGHAGPLTEPEPRRDEDNRWEWPEFGYSELPALNLSPLQWNHLYRRPAGSDHVEARIFDGFLARQLGFGGARARIEIVRALVDAALELSGPAADRPFELGDSFLSENPDVVAGAAALERLLDLFPGNARAARERVSRLWELTRWQPAVDWPPSHGSFYWPAEVLPEEQWDGFSEVADRYPPGYPVFMYVDSRPRAELIGMALDRRAGRGAAARGVIVAIVTGSGADSLDALAAGPGVLLVRPAVPGAGQRQELRQDEQDGVTGWVSGTGWVLVGRGASGSGISAELGSFFGPEQFEQVLLTGLLTPYQAGRLSGHRIVPPDDWPGAVTAVARLAGGEGIFGGLREEIAQALFTDLIGPTAGTLPSSPPA